MTACKKISNFHFSSHLIVCGDSIEKICFRVSKSFHIFIESFNEKMTLDYRIFLFIVIVNVSNLNCLLNHVIIGKKNIDIIEIMMYIFVIVTRL